MGAPTWTCRREAQHLRRARLVAVTTCHSEMRGHYRVSMIAALAALAIALVVVLAPGDDAPASGPGPDKGHSESKPNRTAQLETGRPRPRTENVNARVGGLLVSVHSAAGRPAAAKVRVRGIGEDIEADAPLGSVAVPCKVPSPTTLRVQAESSETGLYSAVAEVRFRPGERARLTLALTHRRFRGLVRDARNGDPITGARVYVGRLDTRPQHPDVLTDTRGLFDLLLKSDRATSEVSLVAVHPDWHAATATLPNEGESSVIELRRRPRFSGQIRTSDGGSLKQARVRVQLIWSGVGTPPTRHKGDPWLSRQAWVSLTDKKTLVTETRVELELPVQVDGSFSTALPFSGEITALARVPGYRIKGIGSVSSEDGDFKAAEVTLESVSGSDSRLRIVGPDGAPLRRILVYFQDPVKGAKRRTLLEGVTDEEGVIDTTVLPLGEELSVVLSANPRDPQADRPTPGVPHFYRWTVVREGRLQAK